MSERADAHLHLFRGGYRGGVLRFDDLENYAALAERYRIAAALVVGYEGQAWAEGNNDYLAECAAERGWVYPVAFVAEPGELTRDQVARWGDRGFVGLSFYTFSDADAAALAGVRGEVWREVVGRGWLVSVNSRGRWWAAWGSVLACHPGLRVLVSHLGLPAGVDEPPTASAAEAGLAEVLALAESAEVRVKLSGLYAVSRPGHAWPHTAAHPYVRHILERFGVGRCVWGSDFSPHLDAVSFPQTLSWLDHLEELTAEDRGAICGGNLSKLLAETR